MPLTDDDIDRVAEKLKGLLVADNPGFVPARVCDERSKRIEEKVDGVRGWLKGLGAGFFFIVVEIIVVAALS